VAVWVRISGLPIEYYDPKVLSFIGDRIGKTVKIDRNTSSQERGKYARLCVEVDLNKPLLGMFDIKDKIYKVEYEGLHLLCLTCGRFGHYKEGCSLKANHTMGEVATATTREQNVGYGQKNSTKEGPWMVVKKPQRSRKTPVENKEAGKIIGKEVPVIINEPAQAKGSRFAILSEDIPILEVNDNDSNDGQRITVNQGVTNNINKDGNNELDLIREENRENILNMPANNNKKFKNKRGNGGFDVKKGEQMIDRPPRDLKLATRGGNTFKGKVGVNVKKGVESYVDMLGVTNIESWTGQQKQDENLIGISNNGQNLGPKEIHHPNRPRPPNQVDIPHDTPLTSLNQPTDDLTLEGETFEDARDQGVHGNYDSDMDVSVETTSLGQ
jgi:hypothetical protein